MSNGNIGTTGVTGYETPEEQAKKKALKNAANGQSLQTVATAAPQSATETRSPEKRQQGSGRFTNLQKYLQANQQAGKQVAGQITGQMGQDLQKQQQQAQDYYKTLGQSVDAARGVANQAQTNINTIGNITGELTKEGDAYDRAYDRDVGAIDFAADPNLDAYHQFQSGAGINEDLLASQQQLASQAAQQYLTGTQEARQVLGSEQGRFDTLKSAFGGASRPDYTLGQQRLDELFLRRQGGLGDLQQDVNQRMQAAQELARNAGNTQDINKLTAREQDLINLAQQAGSSLEDAYNQVMQQRVSDVQQQKDRQLDELKMRLRSDQKWGNQQQSGYERGLEQIYQDLGMDEKSLAYFLRGGSGGAFTYGVDPGEFLQRQAIEDPTQAMNEEQFQRYQALQSILGKEPTQQTYGQHDPWSFNKDAYKDAIHKQSRQFQQDFADLMGYDQVEQFGYANPINKMRIGIIRELMPHLTSPTQPGSGSYRSTDLNDPKIYQWMNTSAGQQAADELKQSGNIYPYIQKMLTYAHQAYDPGTSRMWAEGGELDKLRQYAGLLEKYGFNKSKVRLGEHIPDPEISFG